MSRDDQLPLWSSGAVLFLVLFVLFSGSLAGYVVGTNRANSKADTFMARCVGDPFTREQCLDLYFRMLGEGSR